MSGFHGFLVAFISLALFSSTAAAQTELNIRSLSPGQMMERELSGIETHRYKIILRVGEFFQVKVEQKGIDVALKLVDSNGKEQATMDSPNEDQGTETLSFAANISGNYVLEVKGFDESAPKGQYSIKRGPSRTTTARDRKRITTETIFVEGLAARNTKGQEAAAIPKLEEALKGWRELKDEYLAELTTRQIEQLKTSISKQDNGPDIRDLKIGETVTDEMKAGKAVLYTKDLKKGQLLQVDLIEKGIDLRLGLIRQMGMLLVAKSDYGVGNSQERFTFIVNQAGSYGIFVDGADANSDGGYQLKSTLKDVVTKADEDEIKAEQLLADGWEIKHTGEKQSSANAIVKWDEALKIWRTLKDDYWTAYVGNLLGVMYFNLGEKERGMEYFNEMLPLARAIRDQKGEATILNNIGLFYSNRGENQKAFENFHSALSIFKAIRDRTSEAETLNNIGLVHLNLWENKKALELFNTALPLAISAGDRRGEATSKNNLGGAYSVLGDKQKALEAYTQALKIRESVKDPGGQATSLNNLGLLFLAIGENQKAQIYFENAIPLAKIAEDQPSEATALNGIGLVFSALGENEKALLYFLKALPLVLAAKDDKGQAMTFNNIGVAYSDEGENQKSIQYYDKALALFGIIQDKKGTATTLNNKGLVYSDLGENSKAIEFYYEASSIFREIGDRSGEATSFNNLGWVYSNLKEKSKALELYDKALKHFRDLGERSGQAATLNSTGLVFLYSGEKQRALEYCNQALELFSLIGDRKGEATANNSIGLIYFALEEKQKALEYYNKSFLLFKAFKNRRGEAAVFNNLMVTYKSLGNTNMAVSYGKQSVNVYQELRYFIENSPKGTQRVFLKTIEDTYRFLAELLLSEKRRPEAVQILEMLKREETSSFEDTGIQRDKPDITSTLSINESAYFRKIDEFFAEISQPVSELAKLKQLQDQGIVLTTEEKDRLEKLMIEVGTIEKDFPVKMLEFLGEFTNSPAGGSRAEVSLPIQTELAQYGKDTAFVYTLVGEERYRVILVAQETVEDRQFDLKRADLNNKIEMFRSELLNKEADPQGTGQELFEILIKPLSKELGRLKIKTLLWSLDGKLRLIPMAALWTGKGYFGQEYRNVNVTVSERTSLNKSVSRDWDILGGGTSEPQIIKSQDNKKFSELKYVGNELRGIVKQNATETGILPGKRLYNADFTNDLLSKELNGKYKVIHFASHFVLNSGKMEDSYLVLGDGDILTLQDIRDNKKRDFLSTELLVLSACQTGVTVRDSNGIEIEGFAYLAQEKGADAILSSLWKVADESTSLFMTEFYRMRKADPSLTKAEIIQKIQNKMMNGKIRGSDISERADDQKDNSISKPTMTKRFKVDQKRPYKHPYFWAPFILIGNWH